MPHSTPTFAEIAGRGTILRCQVGSGVHGTAIDGQDDRDEMGVCVEPPEYVIGLRRFEQYIYRTQPEGHRSGPGDLDLVVYSLRKWMRLALQGNPTVLLPLFVPDSEVVRVTGLGRELRDNPQLVVSRQAGRRFLGCLRAQRDRLLGVRSGTHTNRPELVERVEDRRIVCFTVPNETLVTRREGRVAMHGNTKFAMHMVRLGVQGVELLETGQITLPVREPWLSWLRDLRQGGHPKDEALQAATELETRLEGLLTSSPLPQQPDMDRANTWLFHAYERSWSATADHGA